MDKVTQRLVILTSQPMDRRGEERSMCSEEDGVERAAANEKCRKAGDGGGGGRGKDCASERQMT